VTGVAALGRPSPTGVSVDRLVARVASLFVEPRAVLEPRQGVAPGAARALVLGSLSDAPPLAAALAGSLRARERAAAALLCVWTPTLTGHSAPVVAAGPAAPVTSQPAPAVTARLSGASPWSSGGARRLAARLAARELTVRAGGRLAWVALPLDPADAAEVLLLLLGWVEVPMVTVVAGPRTEELDALIADHDLLVAVRAAGSVGEALAALALDGVGIDAVACDPVSAGVARWRARAGLGRLPAGHTVLEALARRVS
jgi:hypothetical protein